MIVVSIVNQSTLTIASPPVDQQEVRVLVKNFATGMLENIRLVEDETLSSNEFRERFYSLFEQSFDVVWIRRYFLGGHYRTASKKQKEEYESLFPDFMIQIYTNRFRDYSNGQFRIIGSRIHRTFLSYYVFVESEIIFENSEVEPLNIVWRVHENRNDELRILDLEVEGVSMGRTQRGEFSTIIEHNGGVEGLLGFLQEFNKSGNDADTHN